MEQLHHKPICPRDMKTQTVSIPLSHLECEQTHVEKTDLQNM